MNPIARPSLPDLSPGYAQYIAAVPDCDLIPFLEAQRNGITALLSPIEDAKGDHRYASGKWSIKELLGHMNDTERIMAYRLLCVARRESQFLPGFEQDDYVNAANFSRRRITGLLAEFLDIRNATLSLLRSLEPEVFERTGVVNKSPVNVAALAYVIAGHAEHHLHVLKERYLPGL
jgi:hypothetical protein